MRTLSVISSCKRLFPLVHLSSSFSPTPLCPCKSSIIQNSSCGKNLGCISYISLDCGGVNVKLNFMLFTRNYCKFLRHFPIYKYTCSRCLGSCRTKTSIRDGETFYYLYRGAIMPIILLQYRNWSLFRTTYIDFCSHINSVFCFIEKWCV